jgi:hypothetical protein
MANADSATNMLWLINQATAGELTRPEAQSAAPESPLDTTAPQDTLARTSLGMDFTNIKIDVTAN